LATELTEAAIDAKLAELRLMLRAANGTLKDIRDERRATEKAIRAFREQIDARLEQAVRDSLGDFSVSIEKAIEGATEAVNNRFDVIAAICLGEDAVSRAEGKPPIEELIRLYIAKNGPLTP
jgi:hypothetical protein